METTPETPNPFAKEEIRLELDKPDEVAKPVIKYAQSVKTFKYIHPACSQVSFSVTEGSDYTNHTICSYCGNSLLPIDPLNFVQVDEVDNEC